MSKNYFIKLKSKTWDETINNMINYSDITYNEEKMEISENGFLYRIENTISFSHNMNKIFEKYQLMKIEKKDEFYVKTNISSGNLKEMPKENLCWFTVKKNNYKKENKKNSIVYKLNEGDVFKLGRLYIRLLKINFNSYLRNNKYPFEITEEGISQNSKRSYSLNSLNLNNTEIIRGVFHNKTKKISITPNNYSNSFTTIILPRINSDNKLLNIKKKIFNESKLINNNLIIKKKKYPCRICYSEEDLNENPLISPCKCSGSMKYIHYNCLKNWLKSKIEFDNTDLIITYSINKIQCELCKETFPDYIKYNNKLYNIFIVEHDFNNYIIIETLRDDKFKTRYIHIISFDEDNQISIGRSEECDFSIRELSISRIHCLMYKEGNNLFIKDNNSKFGTLILNQNPNIRLIFGLPLKIQIGKTYLNIKIEQKSIFFCCGGEESNIHYDYQKQNIRYLNKLKNAFIKESIDSDDEQENEEKKDVENNCIKKIKIIKNKGNSSFPLLNLDSCNLKRDGKSSFLKINSIRADIESINNNSSQGIILRLKKNNFQNNNSNINSNNNNSNINSNNIITNINTNNINTNIITYK